MTVTQLMQFLDRLFHEATPAGQLGTDDEPRLHVGLRQRSTAHETRWYAAGGALAECLLKWPLGADAALDTQEASSVRVDMLGQPSPILSQAAEQMLASATASSPSPNAPRRLGGTLVTIGRAVAESPRPLDAGRFARLRAVVTEPGHDYDDVTKAIELLAAERSERVVDAFLANKSFVALEVLSRWGVERAREPLDELIGKLEQAGDSMLGRVLVARRRLDAWALASRTG